MGTARFLVCGVCPTRTPPSPPLSALRVVMVSESNTANQQHEIDVIKLLFLSSKINSNNNDKPNFIHNTTIGLWWYENRSKYWGTLLAIIAKFGFPTNEWGSLYYTLLGVSINKIPKHFGTDDWTSELAISASNQCTGSATDALFRTPCHTYYRTCCRLKDRLIRSFMGWFGLWFRGI